MRTGRRQVRTSATPRISVTTRRASYLGADERSGRSHRQRQELPTVTAKDFWRIGFRVLQPRLQRGRRRSGGQKRTAAAGATGERLWQRELANPRRVHRAYGNNGRRRGSGSGGGGGSDRVSARNTGDTQQAVRWIEQHLRGFSNGLGQRRAAGGRNRDGPSRVVFARRGQSSQESSGNQFGFGRGGSGGNRRPAHGQAR